MARKNDLVAKHASLLEEFNAVWSAVRDERKQAAQDRRFYSIVGAQWEDELGDQYDETARFELNKIHLAVIRIFSEYRNNRISVDFRPKDKASSSETAETLTGLYRADEQESTAQEAYDNCFEEGVGGGMGAFRLRNVYDDPDSEYEDVDDPRQRVAIEPIFDADSSVFFNLDAKRFDKADARRCWVIVGHDARAWREMHPDREPPASISSTKTQSMFDWFTPDVIYTAEAFEVETSNATVQIWKSRLTQEEREVDDDDLKDADYLGELKALGFIYIRQQKRKHRRIHKYEMDGEKITKDCGVIAGKCIPIVPFYGKRWYVDNIERMMGHVRLAKDAQRLFNMLVSQLAEVAGTTPYEVPIVTPEQIAGHEVSWSTGNVKRNPYRLLNQTVDAQGNPIAAAPVAYVKPPELPPVLAALLTMAGGAIDELTGKAGEPDEMVSNVAAKTVELMQKRLDMQSFIYTDNFAKSMKRSGQIWLSMKKDLIPDEEHDAAIVKPDGSQDFVQMMKPIKDKAGNTQIINDPAAGRFGVWADVGPSFASKRDATVRALINMMAMAQDPQIVNLLMSIALMNMDGEGLEDLRKFMRKKLLSLGVVQPTEEEKPELAAAQANQRPDANTVFLQASAQKEAALAGKAEADTLQSLAKTEMIREQTHGDSVDTHLKVIDATNASTPRVP